MRLFFLLLFILVLASCEKESQNKNSFGTCKADGMVTDVQRTNARLIGTWKWTKSDCGLCIEPGVREADKNITASFTSDGTFLVREDSETIEEGTWELLESYGGFFISLEPKRPSYLDGSIRVCDKELISDARPWDGAAFLFVKVDP